MLINIRFHRSIRLTKKKEVAFLPHGGPTYREIVHVFIAIKKEVGKKKEEKKTTHTEKDAARHLYVYAVGGGRTLRCTNT